jgi:hypothetical protein
MSERAAAKASPRPAHRLADQDWAGERGTAAMVLNRRLSAKSRFYTKWRQVVDSRMPPRSLKFVSGFTHAI